MANGDDVFSEEVVFGSAGSVRAGGLDRPTGASSGSSAVITANATTAGRPSMPDR